MTDELEVPQTVAAYLKEPAVRVAVEALLAVKSNTLPPGLEWNELDTYLRARGGAELTRHDMAHFLRQLWMRLWGEQLTSDWRPAPLDEMVDEEYAVTPDVIWKEKSFTVYHYQKPYVPYTDVKLEPHALSIAFSLEDEDEVLLAEDSWPFRWSDEDNDSWSGWQVFQVPCDPKGMLPALAPLLRAAAAGYEAAQKAVTSRQTR